MGNWFGGGKAPSIPSSNAPVKEPEKVLDKAKVNRTETVFGGKGKSLAGTDKDYMLGAKAGIARKLLLGE